MWQLETRSDVSALVASDDQSHKTLAQQFQELRDQIDPPSRLTKSLVTADSFGSSSSGPPSKVGTHRRVLLNQFDALLQHIRSLVGFINFLRGPSDSEMRCLVKDGAIVVFNVSDI